MISAFFAILYHVSADMDSGCPIKYMIKYKENFMDSLHPDDLKKRLIILTIFLFLATSAMGVLFHFAYDFFHQNAVAALFFPTNESVWEHLKLIFFPMLLCVIIGSIFYPRDDNPSSKPLCVCYINAAALGLIVGCMLTVLLFYTINGILGFRIEWLSIAIYFISLFAAYLCFYGYAVKPLNQASPFRSAKKKSGNCSAIPVWISILTITALCALFFLFTFYPPQIGLFMEPPK